MTSQKQKGILIAVAGIAISLVSIFGYDLGIARNPSFGALQWAGTIIGAAMAVFGIYYLARKQ